MNKTVKKILLFCMAIACALCIEQEIAPAFNTSKTVANACLNFDRGYSTPFYDCNNSFFNFSQANNYQKPAQMPVGKHKYFPFRTFGI